MNVLNDKVALVTGGAVRLGREISLALAKEGCDIVIHYRESIIEAESLAEDIRDMGRQAWLVKGDFTNIYEAASVMRTSWEFAGWIDILVNNAAVFSKTSLMDSDIEQFDEMWRVNTLAPISISKAFGALVSSCDILPKDYCGRIINILDRRTSKPDKGCAPYWMSKKGLEAFTQLAALEMAPRITVNGVSPGPVMISDDPELVEPAGKILLATRCIPSDIANAVIYLAGAITVTGQILYVDSGQHLY